MRKRTIIGVILGLSALGLSLIANGLDSKSPASMAQDAKPEVRLRLDMRKLWEDHISYTRNYIISSLAGLEDAEAVSKRLLQNQDEIGKSFQPYYGQAAADRLAGLLRVHIMIAAEVVARAKAGDKRGLKEAQEKWADNGALLTAFFCQINPNWKKKEIAEMLSNHLELTTAEVRARLSKDWAGDIKNYDTLHTHMLAFSDLISKGIEAQFPGKF